MKKAYIGLYEESGILAEEFAKLGYRSFCIDNDFTEAGHRSDHPDIEYVEMDLRDTITLDEFILKVQEDYEICFIGGFPPCTDLAASGSGHWAKKREINPNFQEDALDLVFTVVELGELLKVPWFFENPRSRVSTMWRSSNYRFDPYEYSGFHEDDCYTKETRIWAGQSFVMPEPFIASSCTEPDKNRINNAPKKNRGRIRSKTPRGFAKAVALANII